MAWLRIAMKQEVALQISIKLGVPMKVPAALLVCILATSTSFATSNHRVNGYVKKDGTFVAPHHSTNPNSKKTDNYGSKGNINPYTGKEGTKDPYASPSKLAQPICWTSTDGKTVCK